jgi:GNAT superfamily N-acetyltransferase
MILDSDGYSVGVATTFTIRLIEAADSRELRRSVLRPALPSGSLLPGDDDPAVLHLGAFDGDALVSACLLFAEDCPWLPGRPAWRLRGMASDPARRGAGAGRAVLAGAVRIAIAESAEVLWCLAREPAVEFYRRSGFTAWATVFDTEFGPHLRMWRELGAATGRTAS